MGSVDGGVDDEGEPPSPQDEVRRAAATTATGTRLRYASIGTSPPEHH